MSNLLVSITVSIKKTGTYVRHPSPAASGVHSSAVERRIADPEVAGSIPVAPFPA